MTTKKFEDMTEIELNKIRSDLYFQYNKLRFNRDQKTPDYVSTKVAGANKRDKVKVHIDYSPAMGEVSKAGISFSNPNRGAFYFRVNTSTDFDTIIEAFTDAMNVAKRNFVEIETELYTMRKSVNVSIEKVEAIMKAKGFELKD